MDALPDITSATRAIRRYLAHAEGKLPDETFAKVEALFDSPSPVDAIVRSAELLYARREELDDEGRTLVAQLASFAAVNGWHGMSDGNRGGLIAQAMRRDMGVKREAGQPAYQKAENDPEPSPEYRPTPEPEAGPPATPAA